MVASLLIFINDWVEEEVAGKGPFVLRPLVGQAQGPCLDTNGGHPSFGGKPFEYERRRNCSDVHSEGTATWAKMGGWAVAQSPILVTTITLERLRKRGYESMLDY